MNDFYTLPEHNKDWPYIEYIEKHVMLDLLLEPFLTQHFVQFEYFPYNGEGLLGHLAAQSNVFMFFRHYLRRYEQKLADLAIREEDWKDHFSRTE